MTQKTQIKSITVLGRKWYDKLNGNTYHTSQIMIDGHTVGKTEFQYGYGDHYLQSAAEWLEEHGHIERGHYDHGSSQSLWQYCTDNGIHLEYSAVYYLKREL